MRLPVAPATATARLWLAAVASAAVIGGAYLLESHGHSWAAAGLVAAGVAAGAARFLASSRADRRYAGVLEHEVATQTRSLVDSLAATADAERHLRMVMDAVPDAIAVLDRDGRVIDLNESAKRLLAAPPNAGAGRSVFASLEADAAATVRERLAAAFRGEVQRFEVAGRREDGTKGLSAMLYAPVRERGEVTRVLALGRDITDQKHTEHQLQQAEKLSAMGQLVSGVAHEINNPAAIISGFAQTLLLDVVKPEQREMLQMIYDEATRIGRITANLLAFARAGGSQRTLVDLNDIVRRTFALRSYHLTTLNIAVTLELSPAEPKFWADPSELQQMLLNLLINAEQALVAVETSRTIVVRTAASEEDVRLEVADSGPGIAPEIRAKIFDPFFTTKPEGVGTGLGLSICYGIAREHGGRIWVDSLPGGGATFVVALPRDPRREGRAVPEPPAPTAPATGPVTVLIVDDETALRHALLRFLGRRGIEGEGVADGADALRALAERDFDVIISDVRMPGMSGREFLERLRRERPALVARLIFSTGDTFAPETAALIQESGLPTVHKPFHHARAHEGDVERPEAIRPGLDARRAESRHQQRRVDRERVDRHEDGLEGHQIPHPEPSARVRGRAAGAHQDAYAGHDWLPSLPAPVAVLVQEHSAREPGTLERGTGCIGQPPVGAVPQHRPLHELGGAGAARRRRADQSQGPHGGEITGEREGERRAGRARELPHADLEPHAGGEGAGGKHLNGLRPTIELLLDVRPHPHGAEERAERRTREGERVEPDIRMRRGHAVRGGVALQPHVRRQPHVVSLNGGATPRDRRHARRTPRAAHQPLARAA